jgi:hypothetical protein
VSAATYLSVADCLTGKESVLVSIGDVGEEKQQHSRQKNEEIKGQSSDYREDELGKRC